MLKIIAYSDYSLIPDIYTRFKSKKNLYLTNGSILTLPTILYCHCEREFNVANGNRCSCKGPGRSSTKCKGTCTNVKIYVEIKK